MVHGEEDFRISLAGAQEKTALLLHGGQWHVPHKLTPTTHIIKLPIGIIHTPRHVLDLNNSVDNELIFCDLSALWGVFKNLCHPLNFPKQETAEA